MTTMHLDCEKAVRAIAEHEHTKGWQLYKIALSTLALFFVFCLGFIVNKLHYMEPNSRPKIALTVPIQNNMTTESDVVENERVISGQIQTDMDDFHQFVFAYDTEQKIENYHKRMEKGLFDETGVHSFYSGYFVSPVKKCMLSFGLCVRNT